MSGITSPYYPPRERCHRRPSRELARLLQKLRGLIDAPMDIFSWRHVVLSLLLPGHAFVHSDWPRSGRGLQLAYALGLLVFFSTLGQSAADVAFGLLIAAHAASVLHLVTLVAGRPGLGFRFFVGLGVWGAVSLGVYFPLRHAMLEHWLLPLKIEDEVLVVNRRTSLTSIQPGDLLAFRIEHRGGQEVSIGGGFGVDEVIARPGDQVRITPWLVQVNGRTQSRRPHMPRQAEFTLAQKQWFVWPRLAINSPRIADARLADAWLRLGMIDETQILGRPFRHWFGRPQSLP